MYERVGTLLENNKVQTAAVLQTWLKLERKLFVTSKSDRRLRMAGGGWRVADEGAGSGGTQEYVDARSEGLRKAISLESWKHFAINSLLRSLFWRCLPAMAEADYQRVRLRSPLTFDSGYPYLKVNRFTGPSFVWSSHFSIAF